MIKNLLFISVQDCSKDTKLNSCVFVQGSLKVTLCWGGKTNNIMMIVKSRAGGSMSRTVSTLQHQRPNCSASPQHLHHPQTVDD